MTPHLDVWRYALGSWRGGLSPQEVAAGSPWVFGVWDHWRPVVSGPKVGTDPAVPDSELARCSGMFFGPVLASVRPRFRTRAGQCSGKFPDQRSPVFGKVFGPRHVLERMKPICRIRSWVVNHWQRCARKVSGPVSTTVRGSFRTKAGQCSGRFPDQRWRAEGMQDLIPAMLRVKSFSHVAAFCRRSLLSECARVHAPLSPRIAKAKAIRTGPSLFGA